MTKNSTNLKPTYLNIETVNRARIKVSSALGGGENRQTTRQEEILFIAF